MTQGKMMILEERMFIWDDFRCTEVLETQVKEWVDVLRDYLWDQVVFYNRSSVFSHFLEGIIAAIEGMKVSPVPVFQISLFFLLFPPGSMEAQYQDARVYSENLEHDKSGRSPSLSPH